MSNSAKYGSLIYDLEQSKFFTCASQGWVNIDIKGPKGDVGPEGAQGPTGQNGANGRDGVDGRPGMDGVSAGGAPGLVIKDGSSIFAHFIQFGGPLWRTQRGVLSTMTIRMADSGSLIEIDPSTGKYIRNLWQIHFMTTDCTGKGFVSIADANHPHIAGRIYVATDDNGNVTAAFRATAPASTVESTMTIRSWLNWETDGNVACRSAIHGSKPMLAAEKLDHLALPDLTRLAPIELTTR